MDNERLTHFKKRLSKEREMINDTIESMKDHGQLTGQRDELSELSMIDNHPADMGTEMFDKEKAYALLGNEENILKQIDTAMSRIRDGSYGKCELCGSEIPEERLEFMPYAVRCVKCEGSRSDYRTFKYDRPVEEENLSYPFGRSFLDTGDDVEFDGEDSWQAVDDFNKRQHMARNYDDPDMEGTVEATDNISNSQYRGQLPD